MDQWGREEQVREQHPPHLPGCRIHSPELPQGSTLFTLLLAVSPQGSGGGAIEGGGAPPPQGSVLVGDVGDATPHGSVEAVPHGTDSPGADTMGGGEGPPDPMAVAAVAGAPHGSTALSSIRAPCRNNRYPHVQYTHAARFKAKKRRNRDWSGSHVETAPPRASASPSCSPRWPSAVSGHRLCAAAPPANDRDSLSSRVT